MWLLLLSAYLCNGQGSMMGYYTYEEALQEIQELSSIKGVEVGEFGRSLQNRTIPYVKVGTSGPIVVTLAGTHPHELLGEAFVFEAMKTVALKPVEALQIYFVPILNIDGYAVMSEVFEAEGHIEPYHKNMRQGQCNTSIEEGVDLNHNFDYQWGLDNIGSSDLACSEDYRGEFGFSEPETQAVRQFFEENDVALILSYHSWGDLYITPFNYLAWSSPDLYRTLNDYDFYQGLNVPQGSVVGTAYSLVKSYANGVLVDWAYSQGAISLAVQIGSEYSPVDPKPSITVHMPFYLDLLNSTKHHAELEVSVVSDDNNFNITVTLKNNGLSNINQQNLTYKFERNIKITQADCDVPASPTNSSKGVGFEIKTILRLSQAVCYVQGTYSTGFNVDVVFESSYVKAFYLADQGPRPTEPLSLTSRLVIASAVVAVVVAFSIIGKAFYRYVRRPTALLKMGPNQVGEVQVQSSEQDLKQRL